MADFTTGLDNQVKLLSRQQLILQL